MIMIAAYFLVLLSVPVAGGRLSRLAGLRVRHLWAVIAAVAVQVLIINVIEGVVPHAVGSAVHIGSYGLALFFAFANRHIAGIPVIVVGGVCNLAAIAANGGVMPASQWATELAGRLPEDGAFRNSAPVEDPKLLPLGDIFPWPEPLPLANVFSIGDVLIVVGAAVLLHTTAASRLAPAARRRLAAFPAVEIDDGEPAASPSAPSAPAAPAVPADAATPLMASPPPPPGPVSAPPPAPAPDRASAPAPVGPSAGAAGSCGVRRESTAPLVVTSLAEDRDWAEWALGCLAASGRQAGLSREPLPPAGAAHALADLRQSAADVVVIASSTLLDRLAGAEAPTASDRGALVVAQTGPGSLPPALADGSVAFLHTVPGDWGASQRLLLGAVVDRRPPRRWAPVVVEGAAAPASEPAAAGELGRLESRVADVLGQLHVLRAEVHRLAEDHHRVATSLLDRPHPGSVTETAGTAAD